MSYPHTIVPMTPDRNNLRGKSLSWLTVPESSFYLGGEDQVVGACRRSRTGTRLDYNLWRAASDGLLLLPGYPLKAPQPSRTMPQLGVKYSKHQPVRDFDIQTTTLPI